ncbi:phosphotransferase [Paenibacillus planticolens]|uniref:Phosphotransferase n=1 Tax=Paenibacillus planticolens TaxID=2654976 RepID=A0ABX1ZEN6_9BACL|nr:phosphotransferase [Paenibacillus planticolens]NOU98550.1 phosphotransferase [Paenibacillus planticolens]
MLPINVHEIPNEIIDYLDSVKDIKFPRQGHTSDVGIVESAKWRFVLKRTRGERNCSWLSNEMHVLKYLSKTPLPIPNVYRFVEQREEGQSWALLQYFEGETLRQALPGVKNRNKKHEMIFEFGAFLAQIHSTPCPKEIKRDSVWLEEMLLKAESNLKHYSVDEAFGDPRYDLSLAIRPKPNAIETNSEIDAFFEGYGKKILNDREYKYFEDGLYAFF